MRNLTHHHQIPRTVHQYMGCLQPLLPCGCVLWLYPHELKAKGERGVYVCMFCPCVLSLGFWLITNLMIIFYQGLYRIFCWGGETYKTNKQTKNKQTKNNNNNNKKHYIYMSIISKILWGGGGGNPSFCPGYETLFIIGSAN